MDKIILKATRSLCWGLRSILDMRTFCLVLSSDSGCILSWIKGQTVCERCSLHLCNIFRMSSSWRLAFTARLHISCACSSWTKIISFSLLMKCNIFLIALYTSPPMLLHVGWSQLAYYHFYDGHSLFHISLSFPLRCNP